MNGISRIAYKLIANLLVSHCISSTPLPSMLIISSLCAAFLALLTQATVVVGSNDTGPVVSLSYATFRGATVGNVTQFLGMPYAQPPYVDRDLKSCLSLCLTFPPYPQSQRPAIPPPVAPVAPSRNTTSRIIWFSMSTASNVDYTNNNKFRNQLHVYIWRLFVMNFRFARSNIIYAHMQVSISMFSGP